MRRIKNRNTEKMSDASFKGMTVIFQIIDFLFHYIDKRIKNFNIQNGMTIVDYGCGPGRYSIKFAKIAGNQGLVYAVDIHELAIEKIDELVKKDNIKNIKTSLATGNDDGKYDTKLPDNIADVVCTLDMFFIIKDPKEFLKEIKRIMRNDGILIIDDGHQSRKITKKKINDADLFDIFEETRDHLKCKIKKA